MPLLVILSLLAGLPVGTWMVFELRAGVRNGTVEAPRGRGGRDGLGPVHTFATLTVCLLIWPVVLVGLVRKRIRALRR